MNPIKPMLCQLAEETELKTLTGSGKYIFEPKYDGERLITEVKGGKVVGMYARSGREKRLYRLHGRVSALCRSQRYWLSAAVLHPQQC